MKALRISKFLEKKFLLLVFLTFVLFSAYRIMRYFGVFSGMGVAGEYHPTPDIADAAIFILSFVLFITAFMISARIKENWRVLLLFTASFFLFLGMTQVISPVWGDAEGYYELSVLAAEKGPVRFIQDYHTMHGEISGPMRDSITNELESNNMYEWGNTKIDLNNSSYPDSYTDRTVRHPPLWPIALSPFIVVFGESPLSALIGVWFISALIPVVLYFLLKTRTDETTAISVAFMFATIPSLMTNVITPLLDPLTVLLVLISAYSLLSGINGKSKTRVLAAGAFVSLAFFTKFTALFVIPVFILIILIKQRNRRGVFYCCLMLLPFAVVSTIFMAMNYYFFLNVITAKAAESIAGHALRNDSLIMEFVLRLNYLFYFGIPMMVLGAIYAAKNVNRIKSILKPETIILISPLAVTFVYPYKIGLDRQLLPLFFLCAIPISIQMKSMRLGNNTVLVFIIICIIQSLLFLI